MDNTELNLNPPAPAQSVQQPYSPEPAEKPRRVRRVGTFTMGIALIILGLALCATMLFPAKDVLIIAKLSPLLLVAIGIEIIIAAAKNDGTKIKYDFLSFFMCLFLIIGAIGASLIPYVFQYIGPERDMASASISSSITDALLEQKSSFPNVYTITVNTMFSGFRRMTGSETYKDLTRGDWVSVYAEFDGAYANEKEFAEAVLPLYNAIRKISPSYIQLSAQNTQNNKDPYYTIDLGSGTYLSLSADTLAQKVIRFDYNTKHEAYLENDSLAQIDEMTENYEQNINELEIQLQALREELDKNINDSMHKEEIVNAYNEQINALQAEIENLQNENNSLQNEISNLQNN